ncbi:MAG: patatin-like phospholipase family protein [Bacteroidetes bacterium]|nr:patatin-like phospholipase family protein [Bacteroidota bacterium]MBL6942745.1 patatin-like phospholipase family protein [Bacteroidales bacterium]
MMKFLLRLTLAGIIFLAGNSCSKKFMVIDSPVKQPEARIVKNRPEVALVLGGGAFHGMAHIGVIKVLEDEGIPIDLIVGTSAGSMVGALYAENPHIDSLIPLAMSTTTGNVFDFSLFRSREGFISGKRLQKYINNIIKVQNIEETEIPFVAVTTDIELGLTVALKAGPIAPSVNASCAIPGIFEPLKMYGTTFVDGGVLDNIATDIALEYNPRYIIAVNIMQFDTIAELKNYTKVFERAFNIASHKLTSEKLKLADIVITPDLKGIPLLIGNEKSNEKMFQLGINAAKKALPEIKKMLEERGVMIKQD